MKKIIILVLSIFLLTLVSADYYSKTQFYDNRHLTNYSVYFNETTWLVYNITDSGNIKLYNLTSNSTDNPILYNINNTNSVIEILGTKKDVLCYNESYRLCGGISSAIRNNDNNINITILANDTNWFFNDANLTETSTGVSIVRKNFPLWITSRVTIADTITYNLSSNITIPINISFYPKNVGCPQSVATTYDLAFSCSGIYLYEINITNYNYTSNILYVNFPVEGGGKAPSSIIIKNITNIYNVSNITHPINITKTISNRIADKVYNIRAPLIILITVIIVSVIFLLFAILYKTNE